MGGRIDRDGRKAGEQEAYVVGCAFPQRRSACDRGTVSDAIERYMADLVHATRTPEVYSEDLRRWIEMGASPRASLALDKCSRTHAWLNARD